MEGQTYGNASAVRDLHKIADGEGVAFEVFEIEKGVKGTLQMADGDGVCRERSCQSADAGSEEAPMERKRQD